MLNFKKHVLTGSAALLLLTAAGAGQAIGQGAGAAPAQRSSANADQGKLEEVIVTAEKRSENLQSVPFSITSLTSRTLVTQGITSFVDYGTKVPNLAFANTGDGIAQARTISIRGISGDNTTGFYIDNTPVPDSVDPRIIDIDHIEVLRGPQGTLYGARSMGGTVRVITKQPNADDMSGSLDANLSTTHLGGTNYSLNGVWNAPLVADKLGLRIVGLYDFESGFMRRSYPDPTNPAVTDVSNPEGDTRTYGGSISMLFNVNSHFSISPRIMYQKESYNGFPLADGVLNANNQFEPLTDASLTHKEVINDPQFGTTHWTLYSFDMKYNTSFGAFTSSTSYFDRYINETGSEANFITWLAQNALGDPTYQPVHSPITEMRKFNRFVQEFRFISDFSGPFQFTGGLYYAETHEWRIYPPAYVSNLSASTGIPGADFIFADDERDAIKEPAVYGEGSYQVTDKLKATVGLRWYSIKYDFLRGYQNGFAANGMTDPPPTSETETGYTPKFNLQYQITSNDMVYGTISKGFRPGGEVAPVPAGLGCAANLASLGLTEADTAHYGSDSIWNYEVGAKTGWFNNRLTVDSSLFWIDWNNIQQQILLACGFQFRANAGAAVSRGAELEVHALPVDGLQLDFGLGYQDAHITKASAGSPQKVGDRVFQTPNWTVSGSATYTVPLTSKYDMIVNATYSYVGNSTSANNDPFNPRVRPAYTLVGTRLGIEWDSYSLTLFGKNLTNEHANFADYRDIAAETPGQPLVVTNQPRTFGVEFRDDFD